MKEKTPIKIPLLIDTTGIEGINKMFGGLSQTTPILLKKELEFKKLVKEERLRVLFNYMKDKSEGGLYKKEGDRVIGSYFGVSKDTIRKLLNELEDTERIFKLSELDKYYKLKEEF